jgi:hypothetical protein
LTGNVVGNKRSLTRFSRKLDSSTDQFIVLVIYRLRQTLNFRAEVRQQSLAQQQKDRPAPVYQTSPDSRLIPAKLGKPITQGIQLQHLRLQLAQAGCHHLHIVVDVILGFAGFLVLYRSQQVLNDWQTQMNGQP